MPIIWIWFEFDQVAVYVSRLMHKFTRNQEHELDTNDFANLQYFHEDRIACMNDLLMNLFSIQLDKRDLCVCVVADMEQLYDDWLQSQRPGNGEENSSSAAKENGKQIHMPTDYAEEVVMEQTVYLIHFLCCSTNYF